METFSCIKLELIEFSNPPKADWIFFSSPKSLDLYLDHFDKPKAEIGVIGEGTLKKARERGLEVSFAPVSTDTGEAISEFARIVGQDQKVLYPKGEKSLNRLHDAISSDQIVDFVFYTTKSADFPQAKSDHLLFTSPSNVKAYFDKYLLEKGQITYAIGPSTAKALVELGHQPAGVAKDPSEKAFWEILS